MAIQQTSFTTADYLELKHLVSGGDISQASKADLERFAVMLCRPGHSPTLTYLFLKYVKPSELS